MRPSRALAPVALAVITLTGCAPNREVQRNPFAAGGGENVLLTVQNNDYLDATIHVYWNGMRTRAGMVTGKTTETFQLRWQSEWAFLEVDFIGARDDYRSDRIDVYPGDHLDFVIMPGLSAR
jgi:hypothetical protein